ncbi:MAG: hypothetical protein ACRDRY_19640 [Pseudonocardiaceae bacterium]
MIRTVQAALHGGTRKIPKIGVTNPSSNPEALVDTDLDTLAVALDVRTDDDWVIDSTAVECVRSRDAWPVAAAHPDPGSAVADACA